MYKTAIKYRAYPDSEQETFFVRSFGCCRKVWNLMLADKEDAYRRDKTILHPTPTQYKEGMFIQFFALQHILKSLWKISSIWSKNIPRRKCDDRP